MTYLTGKRFEYLGSEHSGKTGTIVSEPFREPWYFTHDNTPLEWKTTVAVLWDDGSMEGAMDVELLKVVDENSNLP